MSTHHNNYGRKGNDRLFHVLFQVMKIAQVIRDEFDGKKDLSGIGGVESGWDAAEFLLLGANTVQVSLLCSHFPIPFFLLIATKANRPFRDAQIRLLWKDKTCPAPI